MRKITVNGVCELLEGNMSILGLLEMKNLEPSLVIVEYNYEIPKKETWNEIVLNDGDNIEIVKFIGGG